MKKKVEAILLWGALWGIVEATLGYALHLLPVNPGWFVWFPIAYFFMRGVRNETGSNTAVLFTAAVAASIKFVNILMPGSIDRVVNPAVSILLEAACIYAMYRLFIGENGRTWRDYAGILGVSFLWRALYIGYVLLLPDWIVRISPAAGVQSLANFMLLQSAMNGITIAAALWLFRQIIAWRSSARRKNRATASIPAHYANLRAAMPYCLLIAALVAQKIM